MTQYHCLNFTPSRQLAIVYLVRTAQSLDPRRLRSASLLEGACAVLTAVNFCYHSIYIGSW